MPSTHLPFTTTRAATIAIQLLSSSKPFSMTQLLEQSPVDAQGFTIKQEEQEKIEDSPHFHETSTTLKTSNSLSQYQVPMHYQSHSTLHDSTQTQFFSSNIQYSTHQLLSSSSLSHSSYF
jgi:hypothetical protein